MRRRLAAAFATLAVSLASTLASADGAVLDKVAVRFYAPLLTDVGLLKASTDDLLKAIDLTIFKGLSTELKK